MKKTVKKNYSLYAFATMAFAIGAMGINQGAQAAPPAHVLENIDALGIPEQANPLAEHVKRRAFVKMNKGLLIAGEKKAAPKLKLKLFNDVAIAATNKNFERRSDNSYTWFGQVDGDEDSNVVLTVEDGNIAGLIISKGKTYRIQELPSGNQIVREIDTTQFKDHDDDYDEGELEKNGEGDSADTLSLTTSLNTTIFEPGVIIVPIFYTYVDVMFVYTDDIYYTSGSPSAEMQQAIDVTNQSFADSGVFTRLRKVAVLYANYAETFNSATDLSRIRGESDGYLDWVHWYRDYYDADIVSFWTKNSDACGRGYIMSSVSTGFEDWAFNVVKQSCAVGNMSFAHEVGHNMGARHDSYVDSTTYSPYAYNHGYVNVSARFRTIMAYNNRCADAGVYCTRIRRWSNPDKTYNGYATGIPYYWWAPTLETNNAKTLNNTDYTVSLFR